MKTDRLITNNTILYPPSNAGDIEINICHGSRGYSGYVSLESLEKWLASIKGEIITVATSQEPCEQCQWYKAIGRYKFCPECGLALNR